MLVRRLLTCFFAAGAAPDPRPPPDAGFARVVLAGFFVRDVVEAALVVFVLRRVRFVVVDFIPVFLRISFIALLTMPETNVSTRPATAFFSLLSSLLLRPRR